MPTVEEVLKMLDLVRDNLKNYTESELEDIANACSDVSEDIDDIL